MFSCFFFVVCCCLIIGGSGADAFSLMKLLGIDGAATPASTAEDAAGVAAATAGANGAKPHDDGSERHDAQNTFSADVWRRNADIFEATKRHSFLIELGEGTLDTTAMRHLVVQDAHFVEMYAKAMAIAATKSANFAQSQYIAQFTIDSCYDDIVANYSWLNVTAQTFREEPPTPVTQHYGAFLISTAARRPLEVVWAALMPALWYYPELGASLSKLPDYETNQYKSWIDYMSSMPSAQAIEMLDKMAASAAPDTIAEMHDVFRTSAKLEWMFWDAAYRLENWPI